MQDTQRDIFQGGHRGRPCCLKTSERLKNKNDFKKVFEKGKRLKFSGFRVCLIKNSFGFSRVGLSVSKKVGKAVQRNRIKRRIRELFRQNKTRFSSSFDIIFIPDHRCFSKSWQELNREFEKLILRT